MKLVLPIAIIGALAIPPVFASGLDGSTSAQTAQSNPGDRRINPLDRPSQGLKDDPTYKSRKSNPPMSGQDGMQQSQQPQPSPGDRRINPLDRPSQGLKDDPTYRSRQQ